MINSYNENIQESSRPNTPIIAQYLSPEHSAKLRSCALNDEDIIAARYQTIKTRSEGKKLTGYSLTGLAIPYLDHRGNPYTLSNGKPFYRIRPDWDDDPDGNEQAKYLSPKNEGSRPYFSPTYKQWAKALRFKKIPLFLTEGEFTAAALGSAGYATIGFAGVYSFTDKSERNDFAQETAPHLIEDDETRGTPPDKLEEGRPLPELEYLDYDNIWDGRKVYITFDSDIVQKWQVKNALKKLAEWLESKGADPYIVLLPTELNGQKNGADDFIFRHGADAYKLLVEAAEPAFKYERKKKILNIQTDPILPIKADLLQTVLKDHWRYRPGIGWHQWTGTHWQLSEDGAGTYIEQDLYRFMKANGWRSQGNNEKANLMSHMKAKLLVKEWNPRHKIAFANGILDLATNEFVPELKREDFITVLLPYRYDPTAECPIWLRVLREALNTDQKAIELVQAFFRYAILPKSTKKSELEVCWDLYGKPGTGKGTVIDTLKKVVGIHNCGWFSTKTFNSDNAMAELLDKPVSISPDDSGHIDDPGKFNRVISNEPVQVKILYKNSFSTTLNTFLIRAYNKFITAPSGSQGFDRRIVAMSFDNRPDEIDEELGDKLDAELSGIFNWAYSISHVEMKKRIKWAGEVSAVEEASKERFFANNPVFVFLQEQYPTGGEGKIRDIYYYYTQWYQEKGGIKLAEGMFKNAMMSFGCTQSKEKINGYYLYRIPAMDKFDVIQHLGIRSKAPETPIETDLKNTPDLGDLGDVNPPKSPTNPPKSPGNPPKSLKENWVGVTDSEILGDLRDLQGDFATDSHSSFFISDSEEESSTTEPVHLEESNTPPPPPLNPQGVLTYTRLIMGKIGTTVIKFERQSLAKEWKQLIYQVFGYGGEIIKIDKPTDRLKWKIVYDKFDKEAIERLERKDLSKSPPNRE